MIRLATLNDIPAIMTIVYQFHDEFPFVRRLALERGIEKSELYAAEQDGKVIGFINWHERRDGWSTVYEMGTHREYHKQGIGRALLYSVPCPLSLSLPIDNTRARKFYESAGLRLVEVKQGRKRDLAVYAMNVLSIICRGGSKTVPAICRASGSAYGAMEKDLPYAWPYMADVEFKKPCWWKYMRFIRKYQPVQALVVDYADPARKLKMLAQVRRLRKAGVLRVVVCVKFHGAARDIPQDCIIGVSLRTAGKMRGDGKFAGFMPNFEELTGRKCHLLGGSPALQKDTIAKLQGIGASVISVDGNSQFGSAGLGSTYADGRWNRKRGEKAASFEGSLYSSQHIQRELNNVGSVQQLLLFV